MMRVLIALLITAYTWMNLFAAADQRVPAIQDTETKAQRDARMAWWRAARFGMFIHWGVYSVPGGMWKGKQIGGGGEWILHEAQIPIADYKALALQFNPTKFDADAWVALAKAAGMKYIVITAKHHDGFAMFDSKVDPFNIVDATPFKRDPLKELAAACRKQGIKLGFYYSQAQDWTAPGGGSWGGAHWDKAQDGDFATYFHTKAIPQVKELLTNYGEFPSVIWFDTPVSMNTELASQMVAVLNQHPNLIWNNRLGGGYEGDTQTPEQNIPAQGYPGRDWETCMTINGTWGYKSYDTGFKSTKELLHNLIDIASSGGNYLLNVGPDSTGTIPVPEADRLREMGKWLDVNKEAIYGTRPAPFSRKPSWGRMTQRDGKLYVSIFDWPADGKLSVPISNQVSKAYLLAPPKTELTTTPGANGVTVQLPAEAPDPIATVVVLKITGEVEPIDVPLMQADNGAITLDAGDATVFGNGGLGLANSHLEDWVNDGDYPHWSVKVAKPGKFKVSLHYSLSGQPPGSTLTLSGGAQPLTIPAPPTGDWSKYTRLDAGTIDIEKAGMTDFALKGKKGQSQGVINLQDVTLTPAP